MGSPTRRWPFLVAGGAAFWVVLAAWTVRATWPDRHSADTAFDHYLPLSGDRLFAMTGGPGGAWQVETDDARCDTEELHVDEELRCEGYRFFVRDQGGRQRLVLEGLAADLPATIGTARDADYVLPFPGMGAHQLELLPVDRCPTESAPGHPVVCVQNGGASGSVLVDRSARQSQTSPLPLTREPLAHGQRMLIDERDLLWTAHVPLRVRHKDGLVLLSVPEDSLATLAGDRRFMSLELPSWPLAHEQTHQTERHVFWSRESAFHTSWWPLALRTHMLDYRVEYEQEEELQSFIDHELLCYEADDRKLRWNLQTAIGCDGSPIPAPPADLYRRAELAAYQPGIARLLEVTERSLAGLPTRTPDPAAMVFVFDWAFLASEQDGAEVMLRVPVRLLGVRPGATRNGPPEPVERIATDNECALAVSGKAMPPIEVRDGSTSPSLLAVEDGLLAGGTELFLAGGLAGHQAATPIGGVCVWSATNIPPGLVRLEPSVLPSTPAATGALALGQLHVQVDPKRNTQYSWWSSGADPVLPKSATGACATFEHGPDGFQVHVTGDPNRVRVGEALAEGDRIPLTDGTRIRIGEEPRLVDVVFRAPLDPDRAAFSAVQQGRILRHYPFGAGLSPVLGYGALAGGVEGASTRELWSTADDAWRRAACFPGGPSQNGIELTIRGDLQRIVSQELEATVEACAEGDIRCPGKGDAPSGSAVLLDGRTGNILAVANSPAFDPADPLQVEALEQALRLAGPGGTIQVPTLENRAFLRARNAGSAYKLATAYALAGQGMLDQPRAPTGALSCTRFTWYQAQASDLLAPNFEPNGARSQPCGRHEVILSDSATGFHDAFRKSINLYFGVAPFALLPDSGVHYEAPKVVGSIGDPLENPLGDEGGLWAWARGTGDSRRVDLGVTLAADFDVSADLAADNPFLAMLVATGHRYHYARLGGGTLYTQAVDGVGGTTYPTADAPWLAGLEVGSGYRYPSVLGPEEYAVEGQPHWYERPLTLELLDNGHRTPHAFVGATSSIREYSRLAYGMGGVEASALSLAVLGSPMARPDGTAVTPQLIAGRRSTVGSAPVVQRGREAIERAMRAVVDEPGSTAHGYFSKEVASRIGGKTGTFEIARATYEIKSADPATWSSLQRIVRHACGVHGAEPTAADWTRLRASIDGRSARYKRYLSERPYLRTILDQASGTPPARGFAASAETCADWGLNPGRGGVGTTIAGVDAGVWLDALLGLYPQSADEELVEGSSFIAVVFDGIVDATDGGPAPAEGWVLAVIVDGHPSGAKRAAARILERIRQYALSRQALGMPPL